MFKRLGVMSKRAHAVLGESRSARWSRWAVFVVAMLAVVPVLSVCVGAGPAAASATATPVPLPGISAPPDVVVGETDGYIDLPVTLSAPGESTVSASYTTVNGTAGSDTFCSGSSFSYVGASGTLTFTPGVTTQVVRITLLNCQEATPGTFTFNLSGPVNSTITSASTAVTIVENPTIPGAPTSVSAVAGNHQAVVSFTLPASDGGNSINAYTVTASPGGATASSVGSPITVTGLTNGTAYTFKVTATNDVGTGPASSASNPVTPKATSSVSVSVNPTSTTSGSTVSYKATVTSKAGAPTGTVTFRVKTTLLCKATLSAGVASCAASNAPVGTDTVKATYSGSPKIAASSGTTKLKVS